jgi:TPR repeat protein
MEKKKLLSSKWIILLQVMFVAFLCFKLYAKLHSSENIEDCTIAIKNKNYEKAYKACSAHATSGSSLAKIILGRMYEDGLHVQKNFDQAEKLYTEVANNKTHKKAQRVAQACLGDLFKRKEFARFDLKTSADWFKLSADLGYGNAQFKYGIQLFLGYGIIKNQELAKVYLQKASKNGMKKEVDEILPLVNGADADAAAKEVIKLLNS